MMCRGKKMTKVGRTDAYYQFLFDQPYLCWRWRFFSFGIFVWKYRFNVDSSTVFLVYISYWCVVWTQIPWAFSFDMFGTGEMNECRQQQAFHSVVLVLESQCFVWYCRSRWRNCCSNARGRVSLDISIIGRRGVANKRKGSFTRYFYCWKETCCCQKKAVFRVISLLFEEEML